MVGQRYFTPDAFEIDADGVPQAGSQLFFYLTGTNTFKDTFQDVNLTVENPNPVLADANGRFGSIFLASDAAYQVQFWTAPTVDNPTGAEVWSFDPVGPAAGGAISNTAGIIGEVRMFAGIASAVPGGWYLCYGQAVSRTTYSAAFSVIGASWGAGDGATTFNLPDLRGRGLFGLDNMGGTAAGRITSGVSGIAGQTLGATGGDQNSQEPVLTTSVFPSVAVSVTIADPGHQHTIICTENSGVGNFVTGNSQNQIPSNGHTETAVTGITATATTTATATAVTSSNLVGNSGNMPPAAIVNMIIFLGV